MRIQQCFWCRARCDDPVPGGFPQDPRALLEPLLGGFLGGALQIGGGEELPIRGVELRGEQRLFCQERSFIRPAETHSRRRLRSVPLPRVEGSPRQTHVSGGTRSIAWNSRYE